ncbi:MAG TPA: flagellar biosynthetic protein FliO [Oxalicibacterium sp.]|nr:flagellar biosynthetic protein FliO [Oxalicibacterium sp.]
MRRLLLLPALSVALLSHAAPASAPVATTAGPASAGSLLQVLFGLVIVLGLMALCAWMLRRFSAAKSSGGAGIRIVGGVSVGTRERVMVIEVAEQWIVVGVAPGRISALSTMPKQETTTPPSGDTTPLPRNFSNWLAQSLEKRNAK